MIPTLDYRERLERASAEVEKARAEYAEAESSYEKACHRMYWASVRLREIEGRLHYLVGEGDVREP